MEKKKNTLVMKGVEIVGLPELRRNFSPEILSFFRAGCLSKWLVSHGFLTEFFVLETVDRSSPSILQLTAICQVFQVALSEVTLQDFVDWDIFFEKIGCIPSDSKFELSLKLVQQEMGT